jgi:hypothetical protein
MPASMLKSVMFRPYGITPSARIVGTATMIGARKCTTLSARAGTMSSLISILMPSAAG